MSNETWGNHMLLYHGTNNRVASLALTQGLKPRSETKVSNWKHTIHSNKDCIYLTDAYPLYFAVQAANAACWAANKKVWKSPVKPSPETPAIVEIDADLLMEDDLAPDEDVLEQANRNKDDLPTDWDMKKRTRWYRSRLREYQHAWETSLMAMGTCAHFGAIPEYAIRRIAIIDNKKQAALVWMGMDPSLVIMNYQLVGDKYKALTNWVFGNEFDDPKIEQGFAQLGIPTMREQLDKNGRDGITIIENPNYRI